MVDFFIKVCVVIIGGGVIGCFVVYYLIKKGWNDVVFLECKQLMFGIIWYVVGLIVQFWVMVNMIKFVKYF